MDLRDTILGLLSWRPASGYDLKRIISEFGGLLLVGEQQPDL